MQYLRNVQLGRLQQMWLSRMQPEKMIHDNLYILPFVAVTGTILKNGTSCLLWRQMMGSAECKCEYLAVETALNAAREEAEEQSADKKDLWMLHQLLGICGGSFSDILLFIQAFVFTEDGHWESDNNYNKKLTV